MGEQRDEFMEIRLLGTSNHPADVLPAIQSLARMAQTRSVVYLLVSVGVPSKSSPKPLILCCVGWDSSRAIARLVRVIPRGN